MDQFSLIDRQATPGNQLVARRTTLGEAYGDLISRRGGSRRRRQLLWALDPLAQLRNSDIRRTNAGFEVGEPPQYNLVVGLQLCGMSLGRESPADKGHRGEDE
jgi:hypothetical protein